MYNAMLFIIAWDKSSARIYIYLLKNLLFAMLFSLSNESWRGVIHLIQYLLSNNAKSHVFSNAMMIG
jgi:hypothetical protein